MMSKFKILFALVMQLGQLVSFTKSFLPSTSLLTSATRRDQLLFGVLSRCSRNHKVLNALGGNEGEEAQETEEAQEMPLSKAPSFNGKSVFPVKVFMNGLKGHQVAAVFAIMNKNYKRG